MKRTPIIIPLVILTLFLFLGQKTQDNPYYNKKGKPSTYGIKKYIYDNQEDLIKEYGFYIDSLYSEVVIFTDDLSDYDDSGLGEYYTTFNEIYITEEELYIAYEFKDLSKFKQRMSSHVDRTVKGVVFHELTHAYIQQTIYILQRDNYPVSKEYGQLRIFPSPQLSFGAKFIEEGICEYMLYYLDESSPIENHFIPKTETELLDKLNEINVLYIYSVVFLQEFLDTEGIYRGIRILLCNRPPSYEEILNPSMFFARLNRNII